MKKKRAGVFKDDFTISGFTLRLQAQAELVDGKEASSRSCEPMAPQSPVAAATTAQPPWPAQAPSGAPSPTVFVDERREQRRYRTGRNQQLNLKVRAQDAEAFYAIADTEGWVLGDAFARAVAALARELKQAESR